MCESDWYISWSTDHFGRPWFGRLECDLCNGAFSWQDLSCCLPGCNDASQWLPTYFWCEKNFPISIISPSSSSSRKWYMTQAAASQSWLNKSFTKLKKLKQHFPLFFFLYCSQITNFLNFATEIHWSWSAVMGLFFHLVDWLSFFFIMLQLYELDPTVGQHIEYTFGDGIHNIPTSLYVLEKVQAEVFYHLSPSQVGQKNKTRTHSWNIIIIPSHLQLFVWLIFNIILWGSFFLSSSSYDWLPNLHVFVDFYRMLY